MNILIYIIRKMLSREDSARATEELLELIMATSNNAETIDMLKRLMRSSQLRRRS